MRSFLVGFISILLSGIVISNAFYQKKQFYPSVLYITKSNPSMAVIYFQSLVLVLMLGKLMRKIFLGTLRAAEFEHLMERFWYALTETCLAFTVFRDDFNPKFVALFIVLLFLKSFHWLAEDRVDYMERSPIIGWLFHVRVAGLLFVLGSLDYMLILYAYQSTLAKGATVQLVFGFEYAILITMVANTTIKYVLHAAELRSDTPWENKAVFLLYTELVVGLIRVVLYFVFVILMVKIYTLPLFAFRPMYYTIRNFKKALNDVIMSRRAIHNMNTLYPDATSEELAMSDNICIICREDMVSNSKKLPCGHIFHTACLRSWFQRQQTCPTCRLNILRTPITSSQQQQQQQQQQQPQQQNIQNPQLNNNINNTNNLNNGRVNGNINNENQAGAAFNNPFLNLLAQTAAANAAGATATNPGTTPPMAGGAQPNANPQIPPFMFPTIPFVAPYSIPPPPPPPNLEHLTDEELRAMEGHERKNVEERIKLLKNIQTLLNASVALMNQYSMVMANLPPPPMPVPVSVPVVEQQPSTSSSLINNETLNSFPAASPSVASTASTSKSGESMVNQDKKPDNSDYVKLEDIGSEDFIDMQKPSTSSKDDSSTSIETTTLLSDNDNLDSSGEVNEIRRRRLQKFLN
jgi:E3 ubiquitin-protein ligase synoviolin